jgi:uncharacterized protein
MRMQEVSITHNPAQQRFEATVDGHLCVADYRINGAVMTMTHTFVDPALQGRGIAAQLVAAALAYAREQQLTVAPQCSYVSAYMQRHTEVQDLRA